LPAEEATIVTERKPPGSSWESWTEKLIREAETRGEFENLSSSGQPIPDLDEPYESGWWIRKKLRDEKLSALPPTLQIRREAERTLEKIRAMSSEDAVRDAMEALNAKIRELNAHPSSGPPSTMAPFDVERVVAAWRRTRDRDQEGP
jgi:hypothetical protein